MMTNFGRRIGTAALVTVLAVTQSIAQSLPPLVRNLPQAQDAGITQEALVTRVKRTYPSDIGSGMLSDLLEMDGFAIEETDEGVTASIRQAEFPCITDYIVQWDESERGKVENLSASLERKCV